MRTINQGGDLPSHEEQIKLISGVEGTLIHYNVLNWSIDIEWLSVDEIIDWNIKLLNHEYPTDIITIPYSERRDFLSADILVCLETITKSAYELNQSIKDELVRIGSHGVLHLLGFRDDTEECRNEMRLKESEIIEIVSRGT